MKREPVGSEHEQDTWLRNMLRRSPEAPGELCLDAETLAAWADGALSTKAAAVAELHASNCPRCAAVLAAMERSAPAAPAAHVWTLTRVFRWAAPLAATAAGVAVWIAVSGRPVAPVQTKQQPTVAVPESATTVGDAASEARSVERPTAERNAAQNQNPQPPPPQGLSARARLESPAKSEELQMQDRLLRSDRSEADQFRAGAAAAAPPAAPVPAEPAADAKTPPSLAESVDLRSAQGAAAFADKAMVVESIAPANPLIRWRVVGGTSVERSLDGGKTWRRLDPPAWGIASVRAVDADRAVARSSDNAELYTTDGGRSWTRLQENSAAPF